MEKFFIILLVSIFALIGFVSYHDKNSVEPNVSVTEFVYHGHSYLHFKKSMNYGSTVLHNPDCKKCATVR